MGRRQSPNGDPKNRGGGAQNGVITPPDPPRGGVSPSSPPPPPPPPWLRPHARSQSARFPPRCPALPPTPPPPAAILGPTMAPGPIPPPPSISRRRRWEITAGRGAEGPGRDVSVTAGLRWAAGGRMRNRCGAGPRRHHLPLSAATAAGGRGRASARHFRPRPSAARAARRGPHLGLSAEIA